MGRSAELWVALFVLVAPLSGLGSAAQAAGPAPPDAPRIPPGRIGDRVEYQTTWVEHRDSWDQPSSRQGQFTNALHVEGLAVARDGAGRTQAALAVAFQANLTAFGAGTVSGVRLLDLQTRQILERRAIEDRGPSEVHRLVALHSYGPLVGFFPVAAWGMDYDLNWSFEFQDAVLGVGADLGSVAFDAGTTYYDSARERYDGLDQMLPLEVLGARYTKSRVEAPARSTAGDAFPVRRSLELDVMGIDGFEGTPFPLRAWINTTTWLSPLLPYPVRVEGEVRTTRISSMAAVDGRLPGEYSFSTELVRHEGGRDPIPWGRAAPLEGTEGWARVERTAQHFPADGTGASLEYPLSRAISEVESDAALARFTAWKNSRADYRIVGVEMVGAEAGPTGSTGWRPLQADVIWFLLFASGDQGSTAPAIILSSRWNQTHRLVVNQVEGEAALAGPLRSEKLSRGTVTIAALDEIWNRIAPPAFAGEAPNRIQWGLVREQCFPGVCSPSGWMVAGGPQQLSTAWVGFKKVAWRLPGASSGPPEIGRNSSMVKVDVGSGAVLERDDYNFPSSLEPLRYLEQNKLVPPLAVAGESAPAPSQPPRWAPSPFVVASFGLVGLLAAFVVWKYLWGPLASVFPGFSKLRKSDLLDHPLRDQLVQLVLAEPGITPPEIRRRLGTTRATTAHHLAVLQRNGLLASVLDGRHRRYFHSESGHWNDRAQLSVVRNPRTHAILEAVVRHPGICQVELSRSQRVTPKAIQWHLDRLDEAGLVARQRLGRKVRCFAAKEPLALASARIGRRNRGTSGPIFG